MAINVEYFVPTKIIMDKHCVKRSAEEISLYGSHALIVTGGKSAKLCGALDDVTDVLRENNQSWTVFDRVSPNPTIEQSVEGAGLAKQSGADFIVAIGGGSPMDAGKAIAYYASEELKKDILPIIAIPTTAGTGSEVTPYAILTNHEKQTKTSVKDKALFPKLALLDASYTLTLGRMTTINTAVDALSHAVESMLTKKACTLTNLISREAIEIISGALPKPKDESTLTLEQRERLLYASMLAGTVIANTGTTVMHSMGYSLTYFKNVDHGMANGVLMAEFLKYIAKTKPEPVAEILGLMGMKNTDELAVLMTALLGKCKDISEEEIEKFSGIAIQAWNVNNTVVTPAQQDLVGIYTAALK